MPTISVIIFYILAILGGITIVYGLISLSVFLITIGLALLFAALLLKKEFLNDWIVKMRLGGKSTSMKQQKKKTDEDIRIIKEYGLLGYFTAFSKIARKLPQYILPKIKKYK